MHGPILLYDGLCGLCDGVVRFALAHERRPVLTFATLQGATGRQIIARHPQLEGLDSLILVEEPGTPHERVSTRSDGALRLAHYIGGPWKAAAIFGVVPRFLRDATYDFVARIRYRV